MDESRRGSAMRTVMLLVWLSLLPGAFGGTGEVVPGRAADDAAIQQLLIETILASGPSLHGYSAQTFCVVLGKAKWKDGLLVPPSGPPEPFLNAIPPHGMKLVPGKDCQMISMGADRSGVVEKDTREPAFFITVSDIAYPTASTAEAQAGLICGARCAAGTTYQLEETQDRWVIVGKKDLVIP
jgi:hypothetical protein